MNLHEKTQHQSDQDRVRSRDLSLKASQPPAKIAGFSIEQFIGSGAFGEVWSGTEKKTGRRVAIKFYTRRTSDDVELLAGEVEKLVALSADRYVVQLVDVDWQADPPYFVMDYFERGSLEDLLRREQTLPVAMAEDLFREIATGMMHLHSKGIFHCDLKPANVLLDQDGKPRLADFGQARLRSEQAPSLGTLFFMAPEQSDLKAVPAARWDVYALGAILYCMLVGKPPYQCEALTKRIESAGTVPERLAEYRHSLRSAEPPSEHRTISGVDRMLADIIDRSIDANPKRRFESIQGVMFAMRQRELAKARKPLLILGLLGPLLLLTVMSLFSWFAYRQAYADTETAIKQEAVEGNKFAAKLAARSAAEKIDQYFRMVEDLARSPKFVEDLQRATDDEELASIARQLDDPNDNENTALDAARRKYFENETRHRLQKHLHTRMDDPFDRYPDCASWFVNDLRGNQVASVYQTEPDSITTGRNYSYRTYFHGGPADRRRQVGDETFYEVAPWGKERDIIDHPHMSTIFLSKGTYTWKVAFSVPVRRLVDDTAYGIIGVVACTVEMGHFVDFDNGQFQYAMLIDGREGQADNSNSDGSYTSGVILEHPVFNELVSNAKEVPKKVIDLKAMLNSQPANLDRNHFDDPIAELPEGQSYDKDLIAAIVPVVSPRFSKTSTKESQTLDDSGDSGLFVLVAEDYGEVIDPVERLSARLFWLAIYASIFFLVVALAMWLLVFRMLKDSHGRLVRTFSTSGDSTSQGNSDSGNI